ncbi:D-alanyl-D-alanine carboxypeptidase family protein [Dermabacteraceae bacterium CCM 9520]
MSKKPLRRPVGCCCSCFVFVVAFFVSAVLMLILVLSSSHFNGANGFGSEGNVGASLCSEGYSTSMTVKAGSLPSVPGKSAKQLAVAAQIMQVGSDLGLPPRAQLVAIMTAMQESDLGADPTMSRPDSNNDAGIFQQRVVPGWYGSLADVNDPAKGAYMFYMGKDISYAGPSSAGPPGYHIPGLVDIKGWEKMSLTQAAQRVQVSAFPDAYAKHEPMARKIMSLLAGVEVEKVEAGGLDLGIGCGADSAGVGAAFNGQLPSQAELATDSSNVPCPEGTYDIGVVQGGYRGARVPIRLCSIPGTICTGMDCRKGAMNGRARGEVLINSRVAPMFVKWYSEVKAAGASPVFSSSFRAWSSQAYLYRGGANKNAARPGFSNHQMGAAVDIGNLGGAYSKGACSGHTPDGGCASPHKDWRIYHDVGLKYGGAFHPQEYWHIEWIIANPGGRNLPFATR